MTVESIGWMLIHSLWQGGAVAVLLAAALGVARRAAPSVRYALALAALALMVALPVLTVAGRPRATAAAREGAGATPVASAVTAERETEVGRVAPAGESSRLSAPASVRLVRAVGEAPVRFRAEIDVALPW